MAPMLVDAHAHLFPEDGYLRELLDTCDRLGIQKVCLSGLGDSFALGDNAAVSRALVEAAENRTADFPRHKSYFPVYERAQSCGLPCLLHTGIVTTAGYVRGVSSTRMRPVHVEAIAREFPHLPCICAHLGMPWHEESAALARIAPNMYIDITGAPGGRSARKDATFVRALLHWPGARRKVLWGSDVYCTDLETALRRDRALAEALALSAEMRAAFFGETFLSLLPPP